MTDANTSGAPAPAGRIGHREARTPWLPRKRSAAAPAMPDPLLAMRGIEKRFGGVHALRGVDFDLGRGEVHAVLGENGAGKSTLMNILSGVIAPDRGEIRVGGDPVHFASPRDAQAN